MNPKPPAVMITSPWADELTEKLTLEFGSSITEYATYLGQHFLVVVPEALLPLIDHLKQFQSFDFLVDLTAVDFPQRDERFELIYVLYSFSRNERIRVKTRIGAGHNPSSITSLFLTANWLEREVYDMFGLQFQGHPDLRRILMPDDWQGFPLRKDYGILDMDNRWVRENLGIESGQ